MRQTTDGPMEPAAQGGASGDRRGAAPFEWISRHVGPIAVGVLVISIVLGVIGFGIRATEENPEDPAFDPGGEIYDTADRVEDLFDPTTEISAAAFFVEAPDPFDGDVLTRDALLEFVTNAAALAADPESQSHLTSTFDNDLGVQIDGVYSIAHAVDEQLPDGLEGADDRDVKRALDGLLAADSETSTLRSTLSQLATSNIEVIDGESVDVWRSPAYQAQVVYARESFDIDEPDTDDEDYLDYQYQVEAEKWLRDVQDDLRADETDIRVLGLAIDGNLTDEEQNNAAAPFILGAIVLIVLLVGALIRSYWASAVVAIGLSLTFLAYGGVIVLVGLKDSMLLTFIIPIAVLSFGVDFFVHDFSRCREEQSAGVARLRAYPLGMTAVATAVLLALSTSVAAFVSNVSSDIEAIQEFGIAAAIGLILAYGILGVVGPRVVLGLEERVGWPPTVRGPRLGAKLGFFLMSLLGGVAVTFSVVAAPVGAVMLVVVFLPFAVYLPYRFVRRRNERAVSRGVEPDRRIRGAGHGLKAAGSVVHFFARWRVVTVPVSLVLAGLGLYGYTQVEEKFSPSDFTSSDTDLIKSLDVLDRHFGSSTGTTAYVYVEGDLTDPTTVAAMETVITDLDAADRAAGDSGEIQYLAREFDGAPATSENAADVVRATMESPDAVAAVEAETGVTLTAGPDGLPTDAEQVAAVYEYASANGVPGPGGVLLYEPDDVTRALYVGDDFQATRIEVALATVSDLDLVAAARDDMLVAAETFESSTSGPTVVSVSGEAITGEDSLTAFTASMLLSLVVAFVLCSLITWAFMRSLRYALVSVLPILLVVGWLYLFMFMFDYSINPVTATIAAIAVGVGVDFAMHFTMRFREEFEGEPSRFPALRRAGEGTGGALVLSGLTSIGGFLVMALAPMPIFADFGLLTAVMIFFSLAVALFVLPSLLLLVTPSRTGEERQQLLDALKTEHYDPHSRETSLASARQ